jgi:hypothetical protein
LHYLAVDDSRFLPSRRETYRKFTPQTVAIRIDVMMFRIPYRPLAEAFALVTADKFAVMVDVTERVRPFRVVFDAGMDQVSHVIRVVPVIIVTIEDEILIHEHRHCAVDSMAYEAVSSGVLGENHRLKSPIANEFVKHINSIDRKFRPIHHHKTRHIVVSLRQNRFDRSPQCRLPDRGDDYDC